MLKTELFYFSGLLMFGGNFIMIIKSLYFNNVNVIRQDTQIVWFESFGR